MSTPQTPAAAQQRPTPEILPCPFCGAPGVKVSICYGDHVECQNMDCGLADSFSVTEWNTRAGLNPEAVAGLVAAAERFEAVRAEGFHTASVVAMQYADQVCEAVLALAALRGGGK